MALPNIEKWKLENEERAFYAPVHGPSTSPLIVQIPKMFPDIPDGIPIDSSTGISDGVFCNSDECKISVSTTLGCRNYLIIPLHDNRDFKEAEFWHGDMMIVELRNGNPYEMHISTRIDNSHSC